MVVAADTGTPLRRAQVNLASNETGFRRQATTDGEGRWEIRDIPAGRYVVNAGKVGFLNRQFGFKATLPGTLVVVAEGQTVEKVDMALPRASVVTGRITDEFGEPAAQAQVQVQRIQTMPDGERRMMLGSSSMTDDLGQFRAYGLSPGDYVVSASLRNTMVQFPGTPADGTQGYPPAFYPGTMDISQAQVLTIGEGEEIPVLFSLVPGRLWRLSGSAVTSDGRPAAGAMVMLRQTTGIGGMTQGGAQVAPDGTFTITNVPPGEYIVDVRPRVPGPDAEFGSAPVSVAGDVSGIRLVTGKGATISGRVVWEGSTPRAAGEQAPRVFASAAEPNTFNFGSGPENGRIADDGSFEVTGATGRVRLSVSTPQAWAVKSITVDGQDLAEQPLDIAGRESVTGVRIVMTDRLTDISGSVRDSRGQAVASYVVLIQPADEMDGQALARRLRVVRPDSDGRFRVRGMPPGRYAASALELIPAGTDTNVLRKAVRDDARTFSVVEGGSATLDLTLTTTP